MKVTIHGAGGGEVTGSAYLLQTRDANVLIDLRVTVTSKSIARGDFDKDGYEDDIRYTVEYILANYRAVQLHGIATIDDFDTNLLIDWVVVQKK